VKIELRGRLICGNAAEAQRVRDLLPEHIALTRAEPGCIHFEVVQSEDPLVWTVFEQFAGEDDFAAHQARVKASTWGQGTLGIKRDYMISRA
jgi:quinol monooxygenase YgiN